MTIKTFGEKTEFEQINCNLNIFYLSILLRYRGCMMMFLAHSALPLPFFDKFPCAGKRPPLFVSCWLLLLEVVASLSDISEGVSEDSDSVELKLTLEGYTDLRLCVF